jgi:hypothetical protein
LTTEPITATIDRVTYDLNNLGWKEFEHMVQALATKAIGPRVSSFGAGADGGREATWEGEAASLGFAPTWSGFGVVQAKYCEFPSGPAANYEWLQKALSKELRDWAKERSARARKPDFMLFATNVRLSPAPGGGKDAIRQGLTELIETLQLPVRDFRVWDFDDLSRLLDDASDIRRRYAAFVTSGDVLSQVLDIASAGDRETSRALRSAAARSLMEDAHIGLTQAGAMDDTRVTIADVFVDLPFVTAGLDWDPGEYEGEVLEAGVAWNQQTDDSSTVPGAASFIVESLNVSRSPGNDPNRPKHTVLVGGPGQGKSTITQWLAQLYRVAFLSGSELEANGDIAPLIAEVRSRASEIGMPSLRSRRWPTRVVLTEFADFIAANEGTSLLHFIANQINTGGAVHITTQDLIRWLERYPWVVFIDGLDEVPASSNRTEVVRAIKEFLVDASTAGGDVSIVATTRPQGYANEFHVDTYAHVQLAPLDVATALKCAHALLEVRFAGAHATVARVMSRLEKASEDDGTLRLFTSPLQVTILTILLEKLGKAPGDRWRLFSAYYEIILSREQEKSGGLSELLQRYESDIAAIHRIVGYELQQRSSETGETSSALTREEFEDITRKRFSAQGHDEEAVDALMSDFTQLLTDRLVFLTYGTADKLGFELRSLQEFMAAEHVINFAEPDVPEELYKLSCSSHWRNVVLFAVGGIFAKKEHLRAEVTLLCATLNRDREPDTGVLVGSDLAADILADGSCASIPKYARDLAYTAAEMVSARAGHRLEKLSVLRDLYSEQIVRDHARSMAPADARTWLNRAVLLSLLEEERADSVEHLARLVAQAGPQLVRSLIRYSWIEGNARIAEACGPYIWDESPWDLFALNAHGSYRRAASALDDQRPLWVQHLSALTSFRGESWREELESSAITFSFTPLGSEGDAWEWVEQTSPPSAPELRAIAAFALRPSGPTLSAALRSLASVGEDRIVIFRAMPWVLTACLRFAKSRTRRAENALAGLDWAESLMSLAELAEAGALGSMESWLAAESATAPQSPLEPSHIARWAAGGPGDSPFDLSVAHEGLPVVATGFQFHGPLRPSAEHSAGWEKLRALAVAVTETDAATLWPDTRHLFEFILSQFLRGLADDDFDELARASLEWIVQSLVVQPESVHRWATWLPVYLRSTEVTSPGLDALHNLGLSRWVIARDSRADFPVVELLKEFERSPEHWGILRIVALHSPRAALDAAGFLNPEAADEPRVAELTAVFVIARALDGHAEGEALADAVSMACTSEKSGFDFNWLRQLVLTNHKSPGAKSVTTAATDCAPWRAADLEDLLWSSALA